MNLAEHFPLLVGDEGAGLRLDQFLAQRFASISRSRWSHLIEAGFFKVQGRVAESSQKLQPGFSIECVRVSELETTLQPAGQLEALTEQGRLPEFVGTNPTILFEDDTLMVINKPTGLAVHPGNGVVLNETVVGWLLNNKKLESVSSGKWLQWGEDVLEQERMGIVHRLDKGTSGALVIAKNPEAHQHLSAQFASREASRFYWAVVNGDVQTLLAKRPRRVDELLVKRPCPLALRCQDSGLFSIVSFLSRDPQYRTRFRVSPMLEGKKAITHFCSVSSSSHHSLLELKLETGRTHQIRVHLSFLDFPVLGDSTYGAKPNKRLMLHAHRLRITHPQTNERLEVDAPWPAEDIQWLHDQGLTIESRIKSLVLDSSR